MYVCIYVSIHIFKNGSIAGRYFVTFSLNTMSLTPAALALANFCGNSGTYKVFSPLSFLFLLLFVLFSLKQEISRDIQVLQGLASSVRRVWDSAILGGLLIS